MYEIILFMFFMLVLLTSFLFLCVIRKQNDVNCQEVAGHIDTEANPGYNCIKKQQVAGKNARVTETARDQIHKNLVPIFIPSPESKRKKPKLLLETTGSDCEMAMNSKVSFDEDELESDHVYQTIEDPSDDSLLYDYPRQTWSQREKNGAQVKGLIIAARSLSCSTNSPLSSGTSLSMSTHSSNNSNCSTMAQRSEEMKLALSFNSSVESTPAQKRFDDSESNYLKCTIHPTEEQIGIRKESIVAPMSFQLLPEATDVHMAIWRAKDEDIENKEVVSTVNPSVKSTNTESYNTEKNSHPAERQAIKTLTVLEEIINTDQSGNSKNECENIGESCSDCSRDKVQPAKVEVKPPTIDSLPLDPFNLHHDMQSTLSSDKVWLVEEQIFEDTNPQSVLLNLHEEEIGDVQSNHSNGVESTEGKAQATIGSTEGKAQATSDSSEKPTKLHQKYGGTKLDCSSNTVSQVKKEIEEEAIGEVATANPSPELINAYEKYGDSKSNDLGEKVWLAEKETMESIEMVPANLTADTTYVHQKGNEFKSDFENEDFLTKKGQKSEELKVTASDNSSPASCTQSTIYKI